MEKLKKLLTLAASQIGVTESPPNSNKCKYNDWYWGAGKYDSDYAWCMAFVQWLFAQIGVKVPKRTATCEDLRQYVKKNGGYVTSGYKPGDVLFFDFKGTGVAQHTGIVESVSGSVLTTIEGNTSAGDAGSQDNGGGVFRRKRNVSCVLGAWRSPDFGGTTSTTTSTGGGDMPTLKKGSKDASAITILQLLLKYRGGYKLPGGKTFGDKTDGAVRDWQKQQGLTVDGVCGPKTWASLVV